MSYWVKSFVSFATFVQFVLNSELCMSLAHDNCSDRLPYRSCRVNIENFRYLDNVKSGVGLKGSATYTQYFRLTRFAASNPDFANLTQPTRNLTLSKYSHLTNPNFLQYNEIANVKTNLNTGGSKW